MDFYTYWQKIKSIIGLSFQLAKAEFKLRNEGSYLGFFWYLLNPILTFSLLFLIFNDRLGSSIPDYPLYLMLGIIMFNFFQNTTIESTRSIIENHNLVKSINFPRESLIISIVLKNLFSHLLEVLLLAVLFVLLGFGAISVFYYLPVLILFLFFIAGFSFALSCITVYFVDLENIWNFAARIIWLGTPVFYAIEGQAKLFYANLFNPMYYFITMAREMIIYNKMPELWIVAGSAGFSLITFSIGLFAFNKLKKRFSEMM